MRIIKQLMTVGSSVLPIIHGQRYTVNSNVNQLKLPTDN